MDATTGAGGVTTRVTPTGPNDPTARTADAGTTQPTDGRGMALPPAGPAAAGQTPSTDGRGMAHTHIPVQSTDGRGLAPAHGPAASTDGRGITHAHGPVQPTDGRGLVGPPGGPAAASQAQETGGRGMAHAHIPVQSTDGRGMAPAHGPAQSTAERRSVSPATGLWGRFEQQDFRSRVRGTLLGAAIGDAFGAQAGALTLDAIREEHGPQGLTTPAATPVTAATQLTLFTVDGLIRAHVRRDTGAWHPPTDVHRAYLRWAATQHDWGPDERRKDNGWLARQEWLYARRTPDRACLTGFADDILGTLAHPKNPTARNAAATSRSAPFGLLVGWEPALVLQLAVECATQSHGHPAAYLSAGAFALVVHGLTRGESLDSAVQRALGLLGTRPGHQPVTDALQRALTAVTQGAPGPATVEALATGDAEAALAVAVYCALVAEDIPHGLRLAVNHGGDSTATGALCGALLGALHGETALPAAWLAELEGRATLLELADDFALEMTQGPALHGPTAASPGWLARYPRG